MITATQLPFVPAQRPYRTRFFARLATNEIAPVTHQDQAQQQHDAPDINEQRRIVTHLKSQLAEADAIAQAAAAQLAEISRLPQKLLAQTFNKIGEVTT